MNTLVTIAAQQPEPPRTFRAFRDVDAAIALVQKMDAWREPTLRVVDYGHGVVRVIVNFYGSNKRERVKLSHARRIMWQGVIVNRQLPVIVS